MIDVTREGRFREFARNSHSSAEPCGPCFLSDGNTLFVDFQDDGLARAIHGPFPNSIP